MMLVMNSIRLSRVLKTALAALASVLVAASTAGAATQLGQDCTVDGSAPQLVVQNSVSSGNPYTIPANGVMVKWGVRTTSSSNPAMAAATIVRQNGDSFDVISRTLFQHAAANQASEFSTRVPVSTGEVLGVSAFNSSVGMCSGYSPTFDVVSYNGSPTLVDPGGSFMPSSAIPAERLALWATIEPDADGDGYGDETQDKCPQSAAFIDPCPVLAIGQQLSASKGRIKILATSSLNAKLTASAKIKLSSKKTVTVSSRATSFTAGKLKSLTLKLPKSVTSALKTKRLSATVTLTGSGLANTATASGKVRLRR
jgi:hypothetical protein